MSDYTSAQKSFLELAKKAHVDVELFGDFVPEIQVQPTKRNTSLPQIAYIHTGGTLAMAPSAESNERLSFSGAVDINQALESCHAMARIHDRYDIIGVYLGNEDSKEANPAIWTSIAATIRTLYDDIDGVVVGFGTNTLEYAAAATAFSLQRLAIPVVYASSQIPILGFPGSDGFTNLTGAMEIAAYGDFAMVVCYANGSIFPGTRVTKKNDKRLDIYEARVTGPIGYFTASGIEVLPGAQRRAGKRKHELMFQPLFSRYVTALKIQPGMHTGVLDSIVNDEENIGIILESYGSGAIPRALVPVMKKHVDRGYPLFVTSSCAETGVSVDMMNHDDDAYEAYQAGVRNAADMTTSTATVKLMHVLGNNPDLSLADIEIEMTTKNYAGEITV